MSGAMQGIPPPRPLSVGESVSSNRYQRPAPLVPRPLSFVEPANQGPAPVVSIPLPAVEPVELSPYRQRAIEREFQRRSQTTRIRFPTYEANTKYETNTKYDAGPAKLKYELLSPGEIRLLLLSPSRDHKAPIVGSLECHRLDAPPPYTAISYAWGDRRHTSSMTISGEEIQATVSLQHALAALRGKDRPVSVWVDALSINQNNIQELNSQVRVMDIIYRKARTVAICLGPHSEYDHSRLAIQFLRQMSDSDSNSEADWNPSEKKLLSVVRLFERNYWKRLWVMQEVFHAKRIEVYCGDDSIPLGKILDACETFDEHSGQIENLFPGQRATNISQTHYSYAQTLTTQGPRALLKRSDKSPHPLNVLRTCRTKLAARPQDMILGILSVLPKNIRSQFPLDFSLTPKEVYTEIVLAIAKTTKRLDIICESIRYPFHQDSFGLPSWVPDWSHSPDTWSLAATGISLRRGPFKAWPMRASGIPQERPLFTKDKLHIHGYHIGTITARGIAVGTLCRLSNYLMAFLEWRHILLSEPDYDSTKRAAFCRTICLGDVPDDVCGMLNTDYGSEWSPGSASGQLDQWQRVTYDLFAGYLAKRFGKFPLDDELKSYQEEEHTIPGGRQFFQDYFGNRMMGRCFCTFRGEDEKRHMGMGTGYMSIGDLVVVAHGCSTPIVIRPTNQQGEYEFIGDIYVDGFMDGEVLESGFSGTEGKFVLC